MRRVRAGMRWGAPVLTLLALAATAGDAHAQGDTFARGQSVSPAFEGWYDNDDGTYTLVFGYMNRNWEEELDLPVGAENFFAPGPEDRGQPTHFLPRRNRFVFEVQVPADFGESELTWTLESGGEVHTAYGSLRADYFIDNVVIMSESGTLGAGSSSPALRAHTPPEVELELDVEPDPETGITIQAVVGEPVRLVARVTDDGLPRRDNRDMPLDDDGRLDLERVLRSPPSRITVNRTVGLTMSWIVYRAPDDVPAQEAVTFDPPQVATWEDTRPFSNSPWASFWVPPELPEDDRWETLVTFTRPGTYILMGRADDGGLFTDRRVTVVVRPPRT